MGHRALVAYERGDGLYNVHYTHWGASKLRLRTAITPGTPLGGDNSEPPFAAALLGALEESFDADQIGGELAEPQEPTEVKPDPVYVGVSMDEILADCLDYLHHEAFYVADREFNVEAYRTLWFDMVYDLGRNRVEGTMSSGRKAVTVGFGAIISPRWYPDPDKNPEDAEPVGDGRSTGVFRGAKEALSDLVGDGVIGEIDAYNRLRTFCEDRYHDEDKYGLRFGFDELPSEITADAVEA